MCRYYKEPKLFSFLMTLKTLFVMINEIPDPRLMRNIFLINCLILLFNPLFLSLNRKCVHITRSIIIAISLNIPTSPQIHIFLMERNVITFLFKIFLRMYMSKNTLINMMCCSKKKMCSFGTFIGLDMRYDLKFLGRTP